MSHAPVMLNEVLAALAPADNEIYIDGTFGAGGYTKAFLDSADCTVIAIDRDPAAIDRAKALNEKYGDRLVFIHGCFGDAEDLIRAAGFEKVDGFVLDLGVSSMQLDQAERGFSFRHDAPLDMRMDNGGRTQTAADIVNTYEEKDLADLIYKYGEERHSRRVAKKIIEARAAAPIQTTFQLADIVRAAVPKSPKDKTDQATRSFQALRIAVNDELGELDRALDAMTRILKPNGRAIIVSFHSLEDSRVKTFFRDNSDEKPLGSRHLPAAINDSPLFTLPGKSAVKPSEDEISSNPRSRSARLRAAVRTSALRKVA
jgi:16S rRNA (cytosine1402-N4)-methyltransferase